MTHNETEAERDRRVGANLTSKLTNKTIAKITMEDASDGRHGNSCYGRMSFEFTDGTFFVIDEIGQAGGMSYDVVPATNAEIDSDVEKFLSPEFREYAKQCRDEAAADVVSFLTAVAKSQAELNKFYYNLANDVTKKFRK